MKAVRALWFDKLVAPARLRLFVWLSLVTQVLIVVTGGAVRLTGSGLGCPTWPKCTEESLVSTAEMGFHGLIEFGNRVLTFVLLIVALLTFIVVVRISTSTSKIGKLSIGFFSGAILLVFGLVAHEVLGLVVASILVFSLSFGLMVFFGLFLDPLPMVDLQAADWSGRSEIMTNYMVANPFAIYSMLIAHGMGAALAVFFYTKTITVPSWSTQTRRKPFTGSIVLLALWLWGDVQNDIYDVPVGVLWTAIDVFTTTALSALAFAIAGGLRKHEGTESVTTEDGVYRG